jgi:uncharacterized protein (TIGR02145 family)
MKKFLLSMMLCWSVTLLAQNGVTVDGLAINAGTVTFNVSWKTPMPVSLWSDSVWVFVDYNHAGKMERLPLRPGATLTATSAPGVGKVVEETGNNKGVWVVGNARTNGSFSATVQLLTSVNDVGGACVYASNYPPVGEYISPTEISFTGTPMYELVLEHSNGSTVTVQSGNMLLLPCDYSLTSFTDATAAPGIMKCIPPATYTLSVSASSFCAGSEGVQFSLSGTEVERNYQLFRNNSAVDGTVLNGTGNATTFTGLFNVGGTYTARTVADDLYCEITMDGTRVVVENLLPAIPDAPDVSRQCPGTVILSASSSGAVIDWYANLDAASTLYTGASYTTPEIETSTTYYVQAKIAETGCLSARMPVVAEIITEGCCQEPGATGVTFANFTPCNGASYGASYTLTDDRDNKQYKVKYMPDGRYWMAQDLTFGICTTSSFKLDNSEAATKAEPTVAPGYVGHCRSSTVTGAGYYYNWPAVMNHSLAFSGSTYADLQCTGISPSTSQCQGICPTGWHVPTGNSDGELYALHYALVDATGCFEHTCYTGTMYEGIPVGFVNGTGSLQDTGNIFIPSSTVYSSDVFYNTAQSACCGFHPGTWNRWWSKLHGCIVRCVLNY